MWARKTFANTTLGPLQLPVAAVMTITGHKSEQCLRQYYHQIIFENLTFQKKVKVQKYRTHNKIIQRITAFYRGLLNMRKTSSDSRLGAVNQHIK